MMRPRIEELGEARGARLAFEVQLGKSRPNLCGKDSVNFGEGEVMRVHEAREKL